MARFKVEVSWTERRIYEVEAESRSDIHDQSSHWHLVGEDCGTSEVTFIRDLD